eukprot:27867-Prymnesium_polylepis.1
MCIRDRRAPSRHPSQHPSRRQGNRVCLAAHRRRRRREFPEPSAQPARASRRAAPGSPARRQMQSLGGDEGETAHAPCVRRG